MECKDCRYCRDTQKCSSCYDGSKFQKHTNADRIRSMSDEELAEWLLKHDTVTEEKGRLSKKKLLQWLKSEAKE